MGRIALLRDKELVEFHLESSQDAHNVGDIFLGVVKKVVPGSNAAFVDIGFEKDAFLHYSDLGSHIESIKKFVKACVSNQSPDPMLENWVLEPSIAKTGNIADVLKSNMLILAQVAKEPISSKGHRLTCEFSLAGRYIVLVPFSEQISISKKITSQTERSRLHKIMAGIKPKNFGVIVRTVAEDQSVEELHRDLLELIERWKDGVAKLQKAKPKQKIIGELSKVNSLLRDLLNESFDSIVVDDPEAFEQIRSYVRTIAPDKENIVKLYSGKSKIFETYGIEKQLKSLFGRTVSLPGGGYIVIEHTEALHVIDVNSGNKSNSEADQESTAFKVNLEAAVEIARQLKLRDIGGIIVVDFIDMKLPEHRKAIYDKMCEAMKSDRSKHTILPLSKFGLLQITRQRIKPELSLPIADSPESTAPKSPAPVQTSPPRILLQIEADLNMLFGAQNEASLILEVHPFLHAYLMRGGFWFSQRWLWIRKYFRWLRIRPDETLGVYEYRFINRFGEVIELN